MSYITPQDQERKDAGERKVKMLVIFIKSLFLSRAKAVKMCTGLSALVQWAASSYFAFSITFLLLWCCEPLCVIRLSFPTFSFSLRTSPSEPPPPPPRRTIYHFFTVSVAQCTRNTSVINGRKTCCKWSGQHLY